MQAPEGFYNRSSSARAVRVLVLSGLVDRLGDEHVLLLLQVLVMVQKGWLWFCL